MSAWVTRSDMRWVPLDGWPGELTHPSARRRSPFEASTEATYRLLEHELNKLHCTDVVFEAKLDRNQIRVSDGWPKAKARIPPPIKISFGSTHGPLTYATDRFDHWFANLRAIALGLEALRKVDRYGISNRGEQYSGWAAIPATTTTASSTALEVIAAAAGIHRDRAAEDLGRAIREAKRNTHPDSPTGTAEAFHAVTTAAEELTR